MSSSEPGAANPNLEIERLKKELRTARQENEEYLKQVAHDLQAPLRHISGFVQLLLEHRDFPKDPEAGKYAGYVQEGAKRMSDLVGGMVEVVSAGKWTRGTEPVDLGELGREVAGRMASELESVRGKVEFGSQLPRVRGSRMPLRMAMGCILENCLRYRHPDRDLRIRVSAFGSDSSEGVRIEDNGSGIKREHREAVFRLFKRLHAYDKVKGVGIGLTLSKALVEGQGGRIFLEDGALGGVALVMSFPKADSQG